MTATKKELNDLLDNLTATQLQLVLDFATSLQGDTVNKDAFDYIIDNYNDTLTKLED